MDLHLIQEVGVRSTPGRFVDRNWRADHSRPKGSREACQVLWLALAKFSSHRNPDHYHALVGELTIVNILFCANTNSLQLKCLLLWLVFLGWRGVEGCAWYQTFCCLLCLYLTLPYLGNAGQKGKVMGIFRSLWALARAIGPVVSCTGKRSVLIGSPLGHLILDINLKYYNKPT